MKVALLQRGRSASQRARWSCVNVSLLLLLTILAACGQTVTSAPAATAVPAASTPAPVAAPASTPTMAADDPPTAGTNQVIVDNFSFSPATLTVAVGATVTWVNHDDIVHTVTSQDKRFASSPLDTNDHFSFRFTTPGTYAYYCAIHPIMTGQIIVK
jgi:plastocyanin